MSRRAKREEKVRSKFLYKIIVVAIFLALAFWILKTAPNYVNTDIADKPNLVINNSNVTKDLKKDVIIQDGVIYISKEDIENDKKVDPKKFLEDVLKALNLEAEISVEEDDKFVRTHMVHECFAAKTTGEKEKLIVKDAGHAESYVREPELYLNTVKSFINRFIPLEN